MADNTYGGMSLHQIKDAIDKTQNPPSSPAPKETFEPPNSPRVFPSSSSGVSPGGVNKVKLPMIPKPAPKPKPQKSPARPKSSGYVNYPPPPSSKQSPQVTRPSYENTRTTSHASEDEEEEDQEMYVAPGELEDQEEEEEEEQPIYENHGAAPQKNGAFYANVPAPQEASLYQNINFDGKPHTPPRQIKPSPQVKTKRK